MPLDDFLPQYHFHHTHSITVEAPLAVAYSTVRRIDMCRSRIVRVLFRLRGLPRLACTLDGMQKVRFASILTEEPEREIVLGMVGRFWTRRGDLRRTDASHFKEFAARGFAKACWDFELRPLDGETTVVRTETRVWCLDPASRRRFTVYWALIGPFSGLVRRQALRVVKRDAEAAARESR